MLPIVVALVVLLLAADTGIAMYPNDSDQLHPGQSFDSIFDYASPPQESTSLTDATFGNYLNDEQDDRNDLFEGDQGSFGPQYTSGEDQDTVHQYGLNYLGDDLTQGISVNENLNDLTSPQNFLPHDQPGFSNEYVHPPWEALQSMESSMLHQDHHGLCQTSRGRGLQSASTWSNGSSSSSYPGQTAQLQEAVPGEMAIARRMLALRRYIDIVTHENLSRHSELGLTTQFNQNQTDQLVANLLSSNYEVNRRAAHHLVSQSVLKRPSIRDLIDPVSGLPKHPGQLILPLDHPNTAPQEVLTTDYSVIPFDLCSEWTKYVDEQMFQAVLTKIYQLQEVPADSTGDGARKYWKYMLATRSTPQLVNGILSGRRKRAQTAINRLSA